MVSSNDDFDDNSILACVALLHLNVQIGDSFQQTIVIGPHTLVTDVMTIPGFVVIACHWAECSQDAFKIVLVFSRDVFVDDLEASREPVLRVCRGHDWLNKRQVWEPFFRNWPPSVLPGETISVLPFDRTAHGRNLIFRTMTCLGNLFHCFK